jgi:hypothetical protein
MVRTLLVALIALVVACDSPAPSGQLGLPTQRPTPAPTAPPRTNPPASGSASSTPSRSPSASATASASASASPTASPAPSKLDSAQATQFQLTVRYTAPMRTAIACGAVGQPSQLEGAIDRLSRYATSDPAFDEALRSTMSATIAPDCRSVTFVFAIAAPPGGHIITPSGMLDRQGAPVEAQPAAVTATIADEGRPRVAAVSSSGDRITISFSEPMLEIGEGSGVVMAGNYRLGGAAFSKNSITCSDRGCRTVVIVAAAGTLVVGQSYQLGIANVVDRAGLAITPDPTTSTFVARS